jgi:myo-inositol-1(or 4)-monophosphatase
MRTFERLTAHTNSGGKMVHSLRSMGSAALNICYVATGGLDLYWEIGVGHDRCSVDAELTTSAGHGMFVCVMGDC